jgi:cell division protein FtsL
VSRRVRPSAPPSRLIPTIFAIAIVAIGFATLMVRLEVTEEGYRLSALRAELLKGQERRRRLKLEAAELSSHRRLRALAGKYHLEPAQPGQVVMIP